MSNAKTTTNHATIRRWVEERNGSPAAVSGTGNAEDPAVLRIDFADGEPDPGLEPIEWAEFFAKFDESGLEFLYQEQAEGGKLSRFCKFVNRPR